jgi:hypothetical protein
MERSDSNHLENTVELANILQLCGLAKWLVRLAATRQNIRIQVMALPQGRPRFKFQRGSLGNLFLSYKYEKKRRGLSTKVLFAFLAIGCSAIYFSKIVSYVSKQITDFLLPPYEAWFIGSL